MHAGDADPALSLRTEINANLDEDPLGDVPGAIAATCIGLAEGNASSPRGSVASPQCGGECKRWTPGRRCIRHRFGAPNAYRASAGHRRHMPRGG
jgi:hypothetical protein